MKWLLVLHFIAPGYERSLPAGLLLTEDLCIVAGKGMSAWLEMANPGLHMTWACAEQDMA